MSEPAPAPDPLPSTADPRRICQAPIEGFALRHDDHVDGELARFRKLASIGGRYLEQAGCDAVRRS
jgi:hypothetical protein